jgi:HEAT repeat protein
MKTGSGRGFLRVTAAQLLALALTAAGVYGQSAGRKNPSVSELVEQFKSEKVYWRQFEVAKQIVALQDARVLPELDGWLSRDDRHLRGNAAFIFAALGDERGFSVIAAMLEDRSDRPEGQGMAVISSDGRYHVAQQIKADRYYAVHLLGELKDARAVPVLVPLLKDKSLNYKVAWALGEVGGESAVRPLIDALDDESSDVRVIAVEALEKVGAKEALPRLRGLLGDNEKSHFGAQVSVAEAAGAAIAKLEGRR